MFKLSELKKPTFDFTVTKEVKHDNGIAITLEVKQDEAFSIAMAEVQELIKNNETKRPSTRDKLRRANQSIDANEAMLFVIGEYCIKEWNISVDDEVLAINGDNLLLVLNNVFEPEKLVEFLPILLTAFIEAVQEFGEKVESVKKKPSHNTTGKNKNKN